MPISIAGSGTITGISAGGLPDACIVTADLADGAATPAKTTGGPAFAASANATTSIPNVTSTKVNLGTEDFDTANCFTSSRFTPNIAGYYQFNFSVRMPNILTARADLAKNGAVIKSGAHIGGNTYVSFGAHLIYLNGSTDYIELFCYQASGSAQNVEVSLDTSLSAFLARPA
jgi:hypothetical protein